MLLKLYACQVFIRLRHACAQRAETIWLTPPPSPTPAPLGGGGHAGRPSGRGLRGGMKQNGRMKKNEGAREGMTGVLFTREGGDVTFAGS